METRKRGIHFKVKSRSQDCIEQYSGNDAILSSKADNICLDISSSLSLAEVEGSPADTSVEGTLARLVPNRRSLRGVKEPWHG